MLSSLLLQFRQAYPQGSLTSDLLTIHDGLYVVRVCVGAEGVTLACGMGTHTDLTQAEDLATKRALERLGLATLDPSSVDEAPPTPALTAEYPVKLPPRAAVPELPALDPPLESDHETLLPTMVSSPIALAVPPAPKVLSLTPLAASDNQFTDDFIDLEIGQVAPIDLSDIIAQTDVELQRLGWDVNQGREFLEKTYGKRSRHDLTDDELLEFLLYLETQPAFGSA
ncbi:hypothetical protein IQ254_28505 [Nodosilinea sp. LEGE 07088]|uniref:hypothetical protein n=1 Tax=Nodosilinea sp. LEGE 07088 TaxID=2777968 RepID=UPI00187ECD49|nr:hypothetical protein [Nodosilinea sp. LEGE 07088]MBE9141095.1 hypothetical protein [Nodosilinea sp. LEGE 07088]